MQSKIPKLILSLIVAIIIIIIAAIIVFLSAYDSPIRSSEAMAMPIKPALPMVNVAPPDKISLESISRLVFPEQASRGLPIRLIIPRIDIDVSLEYVGLASDGAMAVPKDQDQVAWFQLGSRPGDIGSAVIAGHYGRKNKRGSAFDNLHNLRPGDKAYIEDDQGSISTFIVRMAKRYKPDANTSNIFASTDGKAHLNLITCEGIWDKKTKSFSERLVVFSDLE